LIWQVQRVYGSNFEVRSHPDEPGRVKCVEGVKFDKSKSAVDFILKCKRVCGKNSKALMEAALWGRTPFVHDHCSSYLMAVHDVATKEEFEVEDEYLNWFTFSYLVPYELLWNADYLRWRLTEPTELEIYDRNLTFLLKQDKLPENIANLSPSVIAHMRKLFGKESIEV